jgi:hypothetical protein
MRASRLVILLAFVAGIGAGSGCKPLYGGKAEAMKAPPKKKPPPEADVAAVQIAWDEECETDFHGKPGAVPPNIPAGRALSENASNTLVQAERAPDPKQRAGLTLEAIDKYKQALNKDPYNAEATYGLAVAYTKVLKKGCTLKLLKRLSDLKNNPKFAGDAQRMIDAASDQNAFKPFKKDAQGALGI